MSENEITTTTKNKLSTVGDDLINQIIEEDDPDKLEDLTNLFKANQRKKDLARINKLYKVLDLVDDEMFNRVALEPEMIDNDQIVRYLSSTQQAINSIEQSMDKTPLIQINNQKNEINISGDSGLNRESRQKVLDAFRSIIEANNQNVIEVDFTEEGEDNA